MTEYFTKLINFSVKSDFIFCNFSLIGGFLIWKGLQNVHLLLRLPRRLIQPPSGTDMSLNLGIDEDQRDQSNTLVNKVMFQQLVLQIPLFSDSQSTFVG